MTIRIADMDENAAKQAAQAFQFHYQEQKAIAEKLLEACKAALALLGDFESDHDGGVIRQLRAAIANVEGSRE